MFRLIVTPNEDGARIRHMDCANPFTAQKLGELVLDLRPEWSIKIEEVEDEYPETPV